MQRGERDLGRADEVEVVVGQPVDLLLGVGQEAGAVQRLLAHEHRRDDRLEAVAAQLLQRPAHERELEHHEVALQVGEARAGHPGRRLHVDQRPGQLEVVAAGAPGLADLAQDRVLRRRVVVGEVRQRGAAPRSSSASTSASSSRQRAARAPPPPPSPRSPRPRPRPRCLAAPISFDAAFCSARMPSSWGSSSRRRASSSSTRSIAGVGAPPGQRGAHRLRLVADAPEVEHGLARRWSQPEAGVARRAGPAASWRTLRLVPAYAATNSATSCASWPTTMFWGMIAPEKPPLRIA